MNLFQFFSEIVWKMCLNSGSRPFRRVKEWTASFPACPERRSYLAHKNAFDTASCTHLSCVRVGGVSETRTTPFLSYPGFITKNFLETFILQWLLNRNYWLTFKIILLPLQVLIYLHYWARKISFAWPDLAFDRQTTFWKEKLRWNALR